MQKLNCANLVGGEKKTCFWWCLASMKLQHAWRTTTEPRLVHTSFYRTHQIPFLFVVLLNDIAKARLSGRNKKSLAPSANHKRSRRKDQTGGNGIFSTHFHAVKRNEGEENPLNLWFTKRIKRNKNRFQPRAARFVCEIRRGLAIFINFMRIQIALMIFQNWLFMFTHNVIKTHSIKESRGRIMRWALDFVASSMACLCDSYGEWKLGACVLGADSFM